MCENSPQDTAKKCKWSFVQLCFPFSLLSILCWTSNTTTKDIEIIFFIFIPRVTLLKFCLNARLYHFLKAFSRCENENCLRLHNLFLSLFLWCLLHFLRTFQKLTCDKNTTFDDNFLSTPFFFIYLITVKSCMKMEIN